MLECLAVIAEANDHSLVEELNLAVKTYVLNQYAEYGEGRLAERAFADPHTATTK